MAGGAGLAGLAVKSQTGRFFGKQIGKTDVAKNTSAKTQKMLNSAKDATKATASKASSAASTALKAGTTIGKLNPAGLVTAAVSVGGRTIGGVEDDGGLADSALDIVEMAGSGSAIGMGIGAGIGVFAGGIGAAPGAAIGATIGGIAGGIAGIGTELWQWATGDDDNEVNANAIPTTNIGAINPQGKPIIDKNKNIVNVEVTNEISPDLIKTTTGVNGDLTVDQESTNSTGSYY